MTPNSDAPIPAFGPGDRCEKIQAPHVIFGYARVSTDGPG